VGKTIASTGVLRRGNLMTDQFRLLRASIPATETSGTEPIHIARESTTAASWTTVLIGRNGVGKSRLLSGIAGTFNALSGGGRPLREATNVEYAVGRDVFRVAVSKKGLDCFRNESPVEPFQMALPSRVIAVTTAPFDKFQLPPRSQTLGPRAQSSSVYRYMGLRDFGGRASATGAVYRALGELFSAANSEDRRRDRIAGVFTYLGYHPNIDVTYRWTSRGQRFARQIQGAEFTPQVFDSSTSFDLSIGSGISARPQTALERIERDDPELFSRLIEVVSRVSDVHASQKFVLSASFDNRDGLEPGLFQDLQLLRRADLVEVTGVLLFRVSDNVRVDLREVSSGELAIVTSFLGIASTIDDSSLIIIDEPELSLHPEWQTQYLERLGQTFASYRNCHFLIATHSPLIVGDMASENSNIVSLDPLRREPEFVAGNPGRSADQILFEEFEVVNSDNLYLRQLVVSALRMAADMRVESDEFAEVMVQLRRVYPLLPAGDPTRTLIAQIASVAGRGSA
jgi:predicted ATPase